jgi:hypothetical protein
MVYIMALGYLVFERHWVAFGWFISSPERETTGL